MSSLVKHRFIKGAGIAGKAAAHIDYIQHRPGEDRDKKIRDITTLEPGEGSAVQARETGRTLHVAGEEQEPPGKAAQNFRRALADPEQRGKVVHKFILSPGEKNVDMDKYTQETMESISQHKGQDLRYAWVVHDNTDHVHAHVVVLGKDDDGNQVRFDRTDHALMRTFGDRYLEREHGVEMQYSKEIEMYARTHSHNLYTADREQTLNFLKEPIRGLELSNDEDLRGFLYKKRDGTYDYLRINTNWKESLEGPSREGDLYLGSTWLHERGRLSEVHDLYSNTQDKERWEDVHKNTTDQELKDYAGQRLADLAAQRQGTIGDLEKLTGLTPDKFDQFIKDIQEEFARENLEIDMALYPEKYEPKALDENSRIDLNRLKEDDKIQLYNGAYITKYDSAESLDAVRVKLYERPQEEWLDKDEFSKLCTWIGTKERHGDDCYGKPPLKEREIEPEPKIEKSLNLEDLSASCSRDLKELRELIAPPREIENPELKEIERVSESVNFSVEDVLDARVPDERAVDETLSMLAKEEPEIELDLAETIEDSMLDRSEPDYEPDREPEPDYEVTYDIEISDEERERELDLDFDSTGDRDPFEDADPHYDDRDTEIDEVITDLGKDQDIDLESGEDGPTRTTDEPRTITDDERPHRDDEYGR